MRFAILGSGAVGGYYGAKLARAGHDVTFIARGAHLEAIRERGLQIRSPVLGDFTVRARAEEDTATVGPVDVVIVAVKAYDNATALPLIAPLLGPATVGADAAERRRQRRARSPRSSARSRSSAARPTSRPRWRAGRDRADRHAPAHRVRRSVRRAAAPVDARARASTRRSPAPTSRRRRSTTAACRSGRSSSSWCRSPASPARRGCRSARSGPIRGSARSSSTRCREVERVARAEGVPVARRRHRADHGLRRTASPGRCGRRC